MTLIIGIICKDAIVLASDSQTTCGNMKRTDTKKITHVSFDEGHALIAHAGNAGNASRFIEIFTVAASNTKVSDYRTPADLARASMLKLKRELREQYCDCTMEELNKIIYSDDLQTELMIAYYFDAKPYIYKLDLQVGRADKEHSHYAAIGCGASLGSYLLSEHTKPKMDSGLASVLAINTVETVCKHDAFCSPPVRIGLIKYVIPWIEGDKGLDFGGYFIYSQKQVDVLSAIAKPIIEQTKRAGNEQIENSLTKETSESTIMELFKSEKIFEGGLFRNRIKITQSNE